MKVKTIQDITNLGDLTAAVEYYWGIQEELSRLELSKGIARQTIIEKFQETGMRYFDTSSDLRARVDTRKGREYINVEEARALLDEDTFNKLLRTGDTIVILSVRPIKAEEENV